MSSAPVFTPQDNPPIQFMNFNQGYTANYGNAGFAAYPPPPATGSQGGGGGFAGSTFPPPFVASGAHRFDDEPPLLEGAPSNNVVAVMLQYTRSLLVCCGDRFFGFRTMDAPPAELGIDIPHILRKTRSVLNPFRIEPRLMDDGDLGVRTCVGSFLSSRPRADTHRWPPGASRPRVCTRCYPAAGAPPCACYRYSHL